MIDNQHNDPEERLEGSVHISRTGILFPSSDIALSPSGPALQGSLVETRAAGSSQGKKRHAALPSGNRLGVASLVTGILSLTTPWLPLNALVTAPGAALWLPFLGLHFAPPAIILGILDGARFKKESIKNKKLATAGLAMGVLYLSLLIGVVIYVLTTPTHGTASDCLNNGV